MCVVDEASHACGHDSTCQTICDSSSSPCSPLTITGPTPAPCPACSHLYTYPGPLILPPTTSPLNTSHARVSSSSTPDFQPTSPALIVGLRNNTAGPSNEYLIQFYSRNSKSRPSTLFIGFYLGRDTRTPLNPEAMQPDEVLPFPRNCLFRKKGEPRKWTHHNVLKMCRVALAVTLVRCGEGVVGVGEEWMREKWERIVKGETHVVERNMSGRAGEMVDLYPPVVVGVGDDRVRLKSENENESVHTHSPARESAPTSHSTATLSPSMSIKSESVDIPMSSIPAHHPSPSSFASPTTSSFKPDPDSDQDTISLPGSIDANVDADSDAPIAAVRAAQTLLAMNQPVACTCEKQQQQQQQQSPASASAAAAEAEVGPTSHTDEDYEAAETLVAMRRGGWGSGRWG